MRTGRVPASRRRASALRDHSARSPDSTPVSGLSIPWDLAFAPDGTMLFTQRAGVLSSRLADGTVQTVDADFAEVLSTGENGLMGIVVDPDFACQPALLHLSGTHRARDAGDRLDHQCCLHDCHPGRRSPCRGYASLPAPMVFTAVAGCASGRKAICGSRPGTRQPGRCRKT